MASVHDLSGKKVSTLELPKVFSVGVRKDLIKRAVIALQSHSLQPYGPNWFSGKDTSAFSLGSGRGLSKIPRVKGGGRGAIVPQAVGGRRAHPPVTERNLKKKINRKERVLATASAIAATSDKELVESRGHVVGDISEFPIIMTDELEGLKKTKDVRDVFSKLGLNDDLIRGGIKAIRSGKGTKRGRKYKRRKSLLVVVSKDENIKKAAENLAGVDVISSKNLNAVHLAPGANPARLTIYTTQALKDIEERFKGVF